MLHNNCKKRQWVKLVDKVHKSSKGLKVQIINKKILINNYYYY